MGNKNTNNNWKEFLSISNKGFEDVYSRMFCYDEMKILSVFEHIPVFKDLTYEVTFWLVNRCYLLWDAAYRYAMQKAPRNINSNQWAYNIVAEDTFYQIQDMNEEGYVDAYARRIGWHLYQENKELAKRYLEEEK